MMKEILVVIPVEKRHKEKVSVQNPFGFNDQLLCKTEN